MDEVTLAEKLLFAKEAAEFLNVSVQRLNKLVQNGKIKPLKKNASGTIFHIDELNRRKQELGIFEKIGEVDIQMFEFDTRTKQEALNFATMMNAMNLTEHRLEPLFDELSKHVPVDVPITENSPISKAYADFWGIREDILIIEYNSAYKAFTGLKKTDEIIKRGTNEYPPLLGRTLQAPRFLYIRGKKSLLQENRTVALVGSRQASEKAKENTSRLASILGKNGITVISGLARGIDVTAHKSALENGFNTVAVIGTNLNQYYPPENRDVQMEIEEKGLIVSQFPPSLKTQRWFFPLRNGVMSGLSLATIIMEAGETSGALKQADFALKQGRQIIIPKNILASGKVTWPHKYVEKGAHVAATPNEIIKILAENDIFKLNHSDKQYEDVKLDEMISHLTQYVTVDWNKPTEDDQE